MKKNIGNKKVILIIRDGWGYRKDKNFNAIAQAKTFNNDKLKEEYPWTVLKASGEAVGLPKGYQGNSEVGHLTIGAGRIVEQNLVRINNSIKDGSFFKKSEFLKAINNCKKNKTSLHLIGLLQKEGVHSHINHLFALLDLCKKERFKKVYIHVITDGRDARIDKGKEYLKELVLKIKKIGFGEIVTISGRYYAMDRDRRWDRTKKAYLAIAKAESFEKFTDPLSMIEKCYSNNETDEFIVPKVKEGYLGIQKKDSIIFYNLRTDRPRQLTQAMVEKKFIGWKREPLQVFFVAMTDYYKPINAEVAFKELEIKNFLSEVLSKNNIEQLKITETEKYAHVTFFLNGQKEKPEKNEYRILVPSPKIAFYDKKPEMSIRKITSKLLGEINKNKYGFIVVNLVNCDMVGHTGSKKAIIKAVEAVDWSVGKITKQALLKDYFVVISGDHGNAEDQTKERKTSHTLNPVPFILASSKTGIKLRKGELKDIAPTILKLMGIKKPKEMTGTPLMNSIPK